MWKTISHNPVYLFLRYVLINSIFAAALYYGFIVDEPIEGAANVALFMGWVTSAIGVLIILALIIDDVDSNDKKGEFREKIARESPKSVIPFVIDLIYDIGVVCIFVWFGHYVLAFFYILAIYAGKAVRDIPKNMVLKNLLKKE